MRSISTFSYFLYYETYTYEKYKVKFRLHKFLPWGFPKERIYIASHFAFDFAY